MKNRFLYIALLLSVGILFWLGRIYVQQNKQQMHYTGEVEHTYRVIITLHNCEQLLTDAESAQRGYLLTGKDAFRTTYQLAVSRIDSVITRLKEGTSESVKQRVNIKLLEPAIRNRIALMNLNIEKKELHKESEIDLIHSKLLMDKIREYGDEIEKEEYFMLEYRSQEKNRYTQLNDSFLRYTFILACIVFLASVLMIIRELRTRVRVQKMLEKTIFELKQSHEEIGQVSFAASHDLQEPLRKIRTMSTLLTKKFAAQLASDEKDIIQRIDRSAEQLHNRLENLIDFINLVSHPEKATDVNLEHVFRYAFAKTSAESAIILHKTEQLPVIQGYEQQLTLLFLQLLSNAVRYRHPERPLEITIGYSIEESSALKHTDSSARRRYHMITIRDNGIGFDQSFNEKIFLLFQRLHGKEAYGGQGIGLTIARRIMTNHYGFIEAAGVKDEAAIFTLWFPAGQ
jgi:signal transduction histidine kinase